jgi:hypothetical protein
MLAGADNTAFGHGTALPSLCERITKTSFNRLSMGHPSKLLFHDTPGAFRLIASISVQTQLRVLI